jgi:hypothetical protein
MWDDVSPLAPLVAGVSQGSPISPLCFSLFIDDMTEVLEFLKYHMYADDLQIYHSRPKKMLFECIREDNSDLSRVFNPLNPSKSMVLPIYRNYLLGPLPALFLVDEFIPYVVKAKNLGVTFSYDLNWVSTIMLAQSAVSSMEPSLGLGDWQRTYLSPFVCDLLLRLLFLFSFIATVSISHSLLIR